MPSMSGTAPRRTTTNAEVSFITGHKLHSRHCFGEFEVCSDGVDFTT